LYQAGDARLYVRRASGTISTFRLIPAEVTGVSVPATLCAIF